MADDGDGGICEGLGASGKVSMFGKRFFESMDHRPHPHALQDPSGVAHWRDDLLVRVCHLCRHSRYHCEQEFALELLQTVS